MSTEQNYMNDIDDNTLNLLPSITGCDGDDIRGEENLDLQLDRMNMNEPPPQFLQQLISHTTDNVPLTLKSEEESDYAHGTMSFLNSDCSYFAQQNSPEQFSTLHSPPHFSNATNPFNVVTCSPQSNQSMSNAVHSLSPMNTRPNMNNFAQPRMCLNNAMLHGSPVEQLPDTTKFPGVYDFKLSLGPHTESATKSADYTYSPSLEKLYVQRGAHCPFKFKTTSRPPPNSYVNILAVFKGNHVLSEPVRRCSNHAEGDDEGNPRYHFIRANTRQAQYDTSESGRLFLTIPYTGPPAGAEFQTELLSFMCFNSCGHSSHSKRRIDVIFTLENNGQVLGRQVIEVRVCACPGRDRNNEEAASPRNGARSIRRASYVGPGRGGKRRKVSSTAGDEEYVIKTNNHAYYQVLSQLLHSLESQLPQLPDVAALRNTSPLSTESSPGNVFKPLQEEDSAEDET
ncbi:cellular tumor antigen p53-like isoform X2 [Hydractinia symbiolongicarpus]|nr:cellular tumor antigen p53-like isoform X2 [Hydractinia symbiolongicarpus]XP_057300067.1 cellular tumor antigen p53-like isoform X2 [Hydractinia symbiolongicarpus]